MKKTLLFALLVSFSFASFANTKIDPAGVLRIERAIYEASRELSPLSSQRAVETTGAFVTMAPGVTVADLEALGYEVTTTIGQIAIVNMPLLEVPALAELPIVDRITLEQPVRPLMNLAREATSVDPVQTGDVPDVSHAYNGENVIVGLYDTGLDPNHINFRGRVRAVYNCNGSKIDSYTTPSAIANFSTENNGETHGTHVAGIMAGSYRGEAEVAGYNADNKVEVYRGDVPFYGNAPQAEIIMGCGSLTTTSIATGVKAVAENIRKSGKPGVINISLGSNDGPHDGSDDINRIFSELSKDAVFCVSAGNEGMENISVEKKFTLGSRNLNTFINVAASSGSMPDAYTITFRTDFWSNTDKNFNYDLVIYDRLNDKVVYTFSVPDLNGGTRTFDDDTTPIFAEAFSSDSYISITSAVSPRNNRYYVVMQGRMSRSASSNKSLVLGINVKGSTNQVVNGYFQTYSRSAQNIDGEFSAFGVANYTDGTPDNSINGMACSPDVIAVGAFATRNNYPTLSGKSAQGWGMKIGAIAPFSSWGKTVDGRKLPVVCAPGTSVIASVNSYYTGKSYNTCSAYLEENDRSNYWMALSGTSMSSPFMAGVVALWLDANPELTLPEILNIIEESSTKDDFTAIDPARWGAGKVDAAAGLKKAIALGGVEGIYADDDRNLIVSDFGGELEVFVGGAKAIEASLFSVAGAKVAAAHAAGDTAIIATSHLTPGIYVLSVESAGKRLTRKVVVK